MKVSQQIKESLVVALFLALSCVSGISPSYALDLASLKSQGVVGEKPDGYLGLVNDNVDAGTKSFVASINDQRRAMYQEIAKKNGTPLNAVETLAAKKAIDKTPSGQMVFIPGSGWVKK